MFTKYIEKDILQQLLDKDFYLMKKFKDIAPGTFKHSQNVQDLCSVIASELDLNVPFMEVCALYHDIGKINNPTYFSENQSPKINVHDTLDPYISYQIISKHVCDSISILLNEDIFPREVLQVISKHHGDGVMSAFYNKALSELNTKDLDDSEINKLKEELKNKFRYKMPKPDDAYSLILMIVDCVEATTRSIHMNGQIEDVTDIENIINKSINNLEQDFQIDNIQLGMLRKIKEILINELASEYHKREIYITETENESL